MATTCAVVFCAVLQLVLELMSALLERHLGSLHPRQCNVLFSVLLLCLPETFLSIPAPRDIFACLRTGLRRCTQLVSDNVRGIMAQLEGSKRRIDLHSHYL